MKNVLDLTLIALTIISCTYTEDDTLSIIPKYAIGNTYNYQINQKSIRNQTLNYEIFKDITISVEKAVDTIVSLNWTVNKVIFNDSTEMNDINSNIFGIQEGITVCYNVDKKGQILQITNYDTIQKVLNQRFEKNLKALTEDNEIATDVKRSSGYGIMKSMIAGDSEQNIFVSDIYKFHRTNGIEINRDSCAYYYEPWVGKKKDRYNIYIDTISREEIVLISELVEEALEIKKTSLRKHYYDLKDNWLNEFSSNMQIKDNEHIFTIKLQR